VTTVTGAVADAFALGKSPPPPPPQALSDMVAIAPATREVNNLL
jgi:hypothetical protein